MKQLFIVYAVVTTVLLSGCGGQKKVAIPIRNDPPQKINIPITKDTYVPFTKDIYNKLLSNKLDLKSVQYYVDQQLVLTRNLGSDKIEVSKGIIKTVNGKQVEEIIIPIYTPGKCELIESDGMRISFESGSTAFKFLNSKTYSPDNFIFTGANWDKDGTCEVDYNNTRYRVNCGTCSSVADAKLVVKQSFLDQNNLNSKTLKGNTVGF